MSSTFQKQFEKINSLLNYGQFKEALEVIEKNLKKKGITKREKLSFLNLKSEAIVFLGLNEEGIELADKVIKESKGLTDNELIRLDALLQKATHLGIIGKMDESIKLSEECHDLLKVIKNISKKQYVKREMQLLIWKTNLLFQKGETTNLIDLGQKAVELAEESDSLFYKAMTNSYLAIYYLWYSEHKNVDLYLDKAFAIANEIKSDYALGMVYIFKSKQKSQNLDYKPAIEFFEKGLEYIEKAGNKSYYYAAKHDLALIYLAQYQLDKALEYFKEALKGGIQEYIIYANIGHTYFLKYDLNKARENTLKALELSHGTGADRVVPAILSTLIQISIELNELEKAQEYLIELGKLSDTTEVKWIKNSHRFNSALVLKASSQMTDWIQAIEILKGIIADEDTKPYLFTDSLYQLVTLYLKELQISADKSVLENVKEQIANLKENAEDRKHYHLLVNIYRLQSQIALIELDLKKAIDYLATARVIAKEKGIEVALRRIEREQEKLDNQMSMWNGFQKNNAPLAETIKQVPLEKTAKEITRDTLIEVRDEESGKIIEYRKLFALKI